MSRMEINSVKDICVLIFLGINSWTDIRKRQVSLLSIVIFAICGTAWSISSKVKVLDFFLCAGIGLVFVGISIFTEDAVGMGDGWLIMALGTVMQPVELFSIIFNNSTLFSSNISFHSPGQIKASTVPCFCFSKRLA